MDVRTVSYLRRYCSCVPNFLAFRTSHEAHVLGFGVPNAKYLAHQTLKYEPHEMFQMSKILAHSYSTVSNMRRYEHPCYFFNYLFIHSDFLSLSALICVRSSHCIFVLLSTSRRSRWSRRSHSRPPQLPLHSHSLPLSSSSCLQPISPKATSSRWNQSRLKLPEVDLTAWAVGLFD